MNWFESTQFDMITIKRPPPGKWGVRLDSEEGNKIFIITNLRLLSSFNVNFIEQGTTLKIDAWLEKDGRPLLERDVLRHVRVSARLDTPDGKPVTLALHTGEDAADGIYRSQFQADQPGEYSIRLTAEAATFKREKEFFFRTARASFPSPAGSSAPNETHLKNRAEKKSIAWSGVILKFGLINVAAAFLITGGYYTKNYFRKLRDKRDASH